MRGEDERRAALADLGQRVPESAAGNRVHAGGRFVKEHDRRVADQRDGRTQLALVSAAADDHTASSSEVVNRRIITTLKQLRNGGSKRHSVERM